MYHFVERDGDLNVVAARVDVVCPGIGGGSDAQHGGRNVVPAAVDRSAGAVLQPGEPALCRIAGDVADGAAHQRVGADAHAVVAVAALHGVGEAQDAPVRAGGQRHAAYGRGAAVADEQLDFGAGGDDLFAERDGAGYGLADGVDVVRSRIRRDPHLRHGRRDRLDAVRVLPRQAGERARRGVAGAVHDGPAGQRARTGANADAVGVHVAFAHRVAERQRVGAAAAVIGGALRPVAEREDDRRVAGDVDDLVELHVHFDVVANRVGVWRETWGAGVWIGADANGLDGWRRGVDAAVHQVPGVRRKPGEAAHRGVAHGVFDPAARQGVGVHADAVGVHLAQLHRVVELQPRGAAAGDEPCQPGCWADCQCELRDGRVCWRGGDMHHLVEGDGEANHIAAVVGVVVRPGGVRIRGDDHAAGDHPRRTRFHSVGGLRRQAGVCARRGVAGGVFDGASRQRRGERPDADAVRVHVVGDHDVAEDQRVRAAAVMVGGRGGFRPNGERELRWRAAQHVDHFVELDFDFDGVAEGVGLVNAGVGDDAHVAHRGGREVGAAVHAMAGLRGRQAGERA